ncbi:MAG: hypothetical protein K9J17_11240 [Flavobacteriales bacterium]|nr:hypothetical protein [Flavobacteriales bacterium]
MVDLEKVIVEQNDDQKFSIRSHPTWTFNFIIGAVVTLGPIPAFLLWGSSMLIIVIAVFVGLLFLLYHFTTDRIELTSTDVIVQNWYLYPIRRRFRYNHVSKQGACLIFHGKSDNRLTLNPSMSPFAGGFLTIQRNSGWRISFGGDDCADWLVKEIETWLIRQNLLTTEIEKTKTNTSNLNVLLL